MSQPPCQGQQEVTSTAKGLTPSGPPGPPSPGVRAPWCFFCLGPGHPPTGGQGRGVRALPHPCHSWQLPVRPGYVEQKSASWGSGPTVGPTSDSHPTLGPSASALLRAPSTLPEQLKVGRPPPPHAVSSQGNLREPGLPFPVSSGLQNTQPLVHRYWKQDDRRWE